MAVLHSCSACADRRACPYEHADDCPTLKAELRKTECRPHEREKSFADVAGLRSAERPCAGPIEEARAMGADAVLDLEVALLRRAGFSLREIEALCRTGWSRDTVSKR